MDAERTGLPLTFWLGLTTIFVSEGLLFVDAVGRDWAVAPYAELPPPAGVLQSLGRSIAVDMTPICWIAYLMVLDGILQALPARNGSAGLPVRRRPRLFVFCFILSIPIWLWFDWVNFSFIDAWRYHGLPENMVHRYLGYFFAFGAICPAMFLTGELYLRLGLSRMRGRRLNPGPAARSVSVVIGIAFLIFPFAIREPAGALTIWLAWILVLDPVNDRLGAPSIIADWRKGRYGRTAALLLAGLTCGLLWEFWNYWAVAKWTYHLPFLGRLEGFRLFEMPVVGYLGFAPFAIECWVMFQTIAFFASKLRPGTLEPPGSRNVI